MPQKPSWSAQRQVQITAVKLLCSMLSAWNACDARQLSGAVAGSRSLLQSSCPTAGQKSKLLKHIRVNESKFLYSNRSVSADLATTGCSSVSASMLESYRNILLTQCSTVTPVGASGGCCSALPASGTPGWSTFVDCACSTLASQVGAFVAVSNVLQSCSGGRSPPSLTPLPGSPLAGSPFSGSITSPPQPASPTASTGSPETGSVNSLSSQPPTPASVYGLNPTSGSNTLSELQDALGNSPASVTPVTPTSTTPASSRTPNTGTDGTNSLSPNI